MIGHPIRKKKKRLEREGNGKKANVVTMGDLGKRDATVTFLNTCNFAGLALFQNYEGNLLQ